MFYEIGRHENIFDTVAYLEFFLALFEYFCNFVVSVYPCMVVSIFQV